MTTHLKTFLLLTIFIVFVASLLSISVEAAKTNTSHLRRLVSRRDKSKSSSKSETSKSSTSKSSKSSSSVSSDISSSSLDVLISTSPTVSPTIIQMPSTQPSPDQNLLLSSTPTSTILPVSTIISCESLTVVTYSSSIMNTSILYFTYSVVVDMDIVSPSDALKSLQTSFAHDVADEFGCASSETRSLKKHMRSSTNNLNKHMIAIDSSPGDIVLGEECGVIDEGIDNNNKCNIITGALSISYREQSDSQWNDISAKALRAIQTKMNQGAYSNIDEGILRVNYVMIPVTTQTEKSSSNVSDHYDRVDQDSIRVGAITCIVVSSTIIIALIVIFEKEKRSRSTIIEKGNEEETVHTEIFSPPVVVETVYGSRSGNKIVRNELHSFEPYPSIDQQTREQMRRFKRRRKCHLTTIEESPNEPGGNLHPRDFSFVHRTLSSEDVQYRNQHLLGGSHGHVHLLEQDDLDPSI